MQQIQAGTLQPIAASLDDIEATRIAMENRVRSLTGDWADDRGLVHGVGLPSEHPEVLRLNAILDALKAVEHSIELELNRQMRKHPLYGWVQRNKGVGEKQAARLLAVLTDPYVNGLHDRPRTVSELWSYAGYGEVKRKVRGEKMNHSPEVKMRLHLIAASCVKRMDGYYRGIYDETRAQYADAVHETECVRCGPSGHPAQPGSALNDGHKHARALRKMCKEMLRALWLEARAYHQAEEQVAA